MALLWAFLGQLWADDSAQDIAEYAVMLAVILVIVVGTVKLIGGKSNNIFSEVAVSIKKTWTPGPLVGIPGNTTLPQRYGFCVGRSTTSLANDCGAWVTSMATTCATSPGCSIRDASLPSCGLRSVSVEPGQITATRMLYRRSSSATE